VLELFKGPLSSVRFADIDATGLTNLAAEVEAAASEVEHHEAKLAELRQGLALRQEALLVLAQQALAYARVYAENDEPLMEELNRISLPRAGKPRKPGPTKATGTRDAVRPEPTIEAAPGAEAEATPIATSSSVTSGSVTSGSVDGEMAAASDDAVQTPPLRAARKARGAAGQRATS
jgi:hypothetical protein